MARRGRSAGLLDGYVVVDKSAGMTSHDVVGRLRRQLGERRIGHAGTLDPDATGVLVVAVGRSTRLLRFLGGADKAYAGTIVLGTATSTLDASGEVTQRSVMEGVTEEAVRIAAAKLTGAIAQVPPMVSAVRVDGRRLYELARAGEEVEREPRTVVVEHFSLWATDEPLVFAFEVECSSGTFVRSLADDLGRLLGGSAHLGSLRRTRVGPYELATAVATEEVDASCVLPPIGLLAGIAQLSTDEEVAREVRHGSVLDAGAAGAEGDGPWTLLDPHGALLAVYERFGTQHIKPIVVHQGAHGAPLDEDAPGVGE